MGKTADLRKLIKLQLTATDGLTYAVHARENSPFPYKTFSLSRVDLGDLHRNDYTLDVDIFDKAPDSKTVDDIADEIESLFNAANLPQSTILPTFFKDSRFPIEEADKDIQHIRLTFLVQLYEIE